MFFTAHSIIWFIRFHERYTNEKNQQQKTEWLLKVVK